MNAYEAELQRVALQGAGRYEVVLPDGLITSSIARIDSMSVAFQSLVYETRKLSGAETKVLSKIADQLASGLTYLLEPLRVIEIDGTAGAVQLRSAPPYRTSENVTYYEVLVERGGKISLVRYAKQPGASREPIAAMVTQEVFLRLIGDLLSAVN